MAKNGVKKVPYQFYLLILFFAIILLARPQFTGFVIFEPQDFQTQAANDSADVTVPQQMSVQGLLKGNNNLPVADGVYNLTFNIYKAYTGGTSLYEERQSSVNIRDGLFNVIISPTLNFTDQYFLGVDVQAGGALTPRINLTSSPYAYRARYLSPNNFTIGYLINLSTTGDINLTGKISCNAIAGNGTGSLDTDFCTDASGGGGGANPAVWINGTSKNIIINDTFGNGNINMSGDVVPDINNSKQVGNGSLLWLKGWFRDIYSYNIETENINASGNIGIAITKVLQNIGGSWTNILSMYDSNGEILLTLGNTASSFNIVRATTSFFYINGNTGNIGIGTIDAKAKLNVIGSVNISGDLNVSETTNTTNLVVDKGGIYGLPYYYSQGLVAYWKFEETSGNRTDSGILGMHLRENVTGKVGYTAAGKIGNAVMCDGSDQGTFLDVDAPQSHNYTNFTSDFSACFWIHWNSTAGTQAVFAQDYPVSGRRGYLYYNNLWLVMNKSGTGMQQTRVNLPQGGAYGFICLTFEQTSLSSYANGTLYAKTKHSIGLEDVANTMGGSANFTVCGRANDGLLFNGSIDEFSLWNRAVSPSFIKWLWNDGAGRELDKP